MRSLPKTIHFFTSIVEPTVQEFLDDPTSIRRAYYIMLYHTLDYWREDLKPKKSDVDMVGDHPDFALVRDICNAAKHCKLKRDPKQITNADQVETKAGAFRAGAFNPNAFRVSGVIATLDNGTKRSVLTLVRYVVAMWRQILGLNAASPST